MKKIVTQFVKAFQKAVRVEMDGMQERLGPFEVHLSEGREIETSKDDKRYTFAALTTNTKLVLHGECTLVHDDGESIVTIIALDENTITVRCDRKISMDSSSYALVIYPWFLYERLLLVLESLPDSTSFCARSALALFGKAKPRLEHRTAHSTGEELNASQQRAVALCRDSSTAFVWGPPGTGKTTTLGHIVTELLGQGYRILVTSTTNAAVDQALAKLATLPAANDYLSSGQIVRVGQTHAETFGASLGEVVRRQNKELREKLTVLRDRRDDATARISTCDDLLDKLLPSGQAHQLDMFSAAGEQGFTRMDLGELHGPSMTAHLLDLTPDDQRRLLDTRRNRLLRVRDLCQERVEEYVDVLYGEEQTVIKNARVIMATMTNMYISQLLIDERFDVVIVEEAGMAILPTLFYCAGLGQEKVIAIGDPRQLPPIVQSQDSYVHEAMGRNIFQVTVPEPHASAVVAMLDTQYRMHPVIGSFVGDMFYDGRLINADSTIERSSIAEKHPYPGQALTVIDTNGSTTCTIAEGSFSRLNEQTARLCVSLAVDAIGDGIQSVAIVTPYARQASLIRDLLTSARVPTDRVECRTVHKFQGNERDMVIFDTVDTYPMKPGVLLAGNKGKTSAPNLINVSVSRAKGKLIMISDVSYFHSEAPGSAIDLTLSSAAAAGNLCQGPQDY